MHKIRMKWCENVLQGMMDDGVKCVNFLRNATRVKPNLCLLDFKTSQLMTLISFQQTHMKLHI